MVGCAGKALTVAVTPVLVAVVHPLFVASTYKVVVDEILGVVYDVPAPSDPPPDEAAYQLTTPADAVAPNVTGPVPQRDPGVVPVMVGIALTVKGWVAETEPQLFVTVYVTVTKPALKPVTTPPVVILAVPVPGTIDQVPPPVASVKAGVVELTQTLAAPPPIADTVGSGLTTCILLAVDVPHDPPLVVSVNVDVPLYPPGGVHVGFNVVALGLKVPPAGVDHVPPVAEPPILPPNAAEVPP
jgi:hypothetical protein